MILRAVPRLKTATRPWDTHRPGTRIATAPPDTVLQVTPRERQAHQALLQGGMGLSQGEPPLQGATRLLQRAATARDVPNEHVIAAMATMELDNPTAVPLAQLEGTWRLVFSSSSSIPAFQVVVRWGIVTWLR